MAQFSCFDGNLVFECDDGRFSIGLGDEAPAFESREFALRVASGKPPVSVPVAKFRRFRLIREARDAPAARS